MTLNTNLKASWRWTIWTLLAIAVGGLILFMEHTQGQVIRRDWLAGLLWLAPLALLIWWNGLGRNPPDKPTMRKWAPLVALFVMMTLYLVSSGVLNKWFFFLNWIPDNRPLLNSGWERTLLLTALFTPLLLLKPGARKPLIALSFFLGMTACIWSLLSTTHGLPLWRDDHPSFLFRLWEFSKTFPRLLNYNPYWNAGTVEFIPTTSGTNIMGLLLWPVWKLIQPHIVYTYALAFVYIIVMPVVGYISLRLMGADRTAAFTAGTLALGVSQHFFLWMLHYGTIGAAFASLCVLPLSATLYRVFWVPGLKKTFAPAVILSALFLILWPAGAVMMGPVALGALFSIRRLTLRKFLFLAACGAVVLILFLRPLTLILFNKGSPLSFVMGQDPGSRPVETHQLWTWEIAAQGWEYLFAHLAEINPLILFLGIGAGLVFPMKSIRRWLWPMLIGFALLTGWGRDWKPDMQLTRMSIPLAFVAVIPASLAVSRLLRIRRRGLVFIQAGLIALLFMTGHTVSRLYANRGLAKYVTQDDDVRAIAAWVKDHVPEGGRLMFSSRNVHLYGGGHIAYFPVLTGREMMASDYYHFPPSTVDYEYPPRPYRQNAATILEFARLYNITHIIAYHPKWKKVLEQDPAGFQKEIDIGIWTLYRVNIEPSLLLKGSGQVNARFNRIDARLDEPVDEIVLKYNWIDGLMIAPPAELFPHKVDEHTTLIGIRPNGETELRVRY